MKTILIRRRKKKRVTMKRATIIKYIFLSTVQFRTVCFPSSASAPRSLSRVITEPCRVVKRTVFFGIISKNKAITEFYIKFINIKIFIFSE